MTRPKEPTQLELELRMQRAAKEPSPEDDANAPDTDPADLTDDETLPSPEEEFEHEDIWSDPDI